MDDADTEMLILDTITERFEVALLDGGTLAEAKARLQQRFDDIRSLHRNVPLTTVACAMWRAFGRYEGRLAERESRGHLDE